MFKDVKVFTDDNVKKVVFEIEDAIFESVVYKYGTYKDRTVICCSTQSGCPVGCTFCGTGKRFVRNLTAGEIVNQVTYIVNNIVLKEIDSSENIEKFQIMFMSMGEPMLNFEEVSKAIKDLNGIYTNAQLLLSTVGIDNDKTLIQLLEISKQIDKVGLQFSIHQSDEDKRNKLIPFKNKMDLRKIRDYGEEWARLTGRPVYLNYCIDGNNTSNKEMDRLKDLFSPRWFYFTFSVICNINQDNKLESSGFEDLDYIKKIADGFIQDGYNVRIFDPAGKDTIGGGCGQLWYVQEWLKSYK